MNKNDQYPFNNLDQFQSKLDNLDKFQLSLYLLPVVGIIPSLISLYSEYSNAQQKKVSKISTNLFVIWIFFYSILSLGSSLNNIETITLRLLYLNALLTTGYFLSCLIFTWIIWQGKIPSFSLLKLPQKSKRKK